MTALGTALFVALLGIGVLALVLGLRPVADRRVAPKRLSLRDLRLWLRSHRTPTYLIAGLVFGLLGWLLTGYFALVILVPVLFFLVPALLAPPAATGHIAKLEAMEEWTRSLAGVMGAGAGIEQAILSSARSAPKPLRAEVNLLAARIQSGVPTVAALRQLADDLDDQTGDVLAGSLILGASRRGIGLTRVLEGAAETIAEDVAIRREIEADRAKPRSNARVITLITLVVIALLFTVGHQYAQPYQTFLGQLILVALGGLYLASLWWMQYLTREPAPERFLAEEAS